MSATLHESVNLLGLILVVGDDVVPEDLPGFAAWHDPVSQVKKPEGNK